VPAAIGRLRDRYEEIEARHREVVGDDPFDIFLGPDEWADEERAKAREKAEIDALRELALLEAIGRAEPTVQSNLTRPLPPEPDVRRRGRKSKWRTSTLEAITKRLANGESHRSIAADLGIRHQRISDVDVGVEPGDRAGRADPDPAVLGDP
jgi:hypothetical protein